MNTKGLRIRKTAGYALGKLMEIQCQGLHRNHEIIQLFNRYLLSVYLSQALFYVMAFRVEHSRQDPLSISKDSQTKLNDLEKVSVLSFPHLRKVYKVFTRIK